MKMKISVLLVAFISYIVIYSVCCQPCAIIASKSLDTIGVDNCIGLCSVDNQIYGHYVVIIENKAYEPRFLGLYHCDHIDYNNSYKLLTADELMQKKRICTRSAIDIFKYYYGNA